MASCTPRAVASVLLAFVLVLLPGAPRASAEGGLVTSDLASDLTPEDLVDTLLAEDSGITIVPGTVQYTGAPAAAGLFGGGEEAIGFDAGIILSTGNVANVVGPNDHDGVTGNHERAGYAPLTTIAGVDTRDAALLAFDFVPEGNKIAFIYVFGSEEYNEFVNNVNDAFAFFVNGTNYAQVTTLDGSVVPITINTINSGNPYSATGATGANPE